MAVNAAEFQKVTAEERAAPWRDGVCERMCYLHAGLGRCVIGAVYTWRRSTNQARA